MDQIVSRHTDLRVRKEKKKEKREKARLSTGRRRLLSLLRSLLFAESFLRRLGNAISRRQPGREHETTSCHDHVKLGRLLLRSSFSVVRPPRDRSSWRRQNKTRNERCMKNLDDDLGDCAIWIRKCSVNIMLGYHIRHHPFTFRFVRPNTV